MLTSKWQGVGDLEYRFLACGHDDAFFGATVAGRSGSSSVLFGQQPAQAVLEKLHVSNGYAPLDLRAGIELDANDLCVEFWGRNVTNRYYTISNIRSEDSVSRLQGNRQPMALP